MPVGLALPAAAGGLAAGSFLAAAAHRLPRGMSLLAPPSRCPACGRRLRPAELIPVLSFALQRGRCRGCGGPIGWRYPAVEAANALLWALVAWRAALPAQAALGWALASTCVLASAVDLERRLIPNRLTLAAALVWVPLGLWSGHPLDGLAGGALFGGLLLLAALVRPGAMGMGDVKLAAVAGLYLGWRPAAAAFLLAVASGAVAGLALVALRVKSRRDSIPFGPFLALGSLAAFLWGQPLISWYLGL